MTNELTIAATYLSFTENTSPSLDDMYTYLKFSEQFGTAAATASIIQNQAIGNVLFGNVLSNADKVKTVFNALFNRDPLQGGLDYWVDQLENNSSYVNETSMVVTILRGAEVNEDQTDFDYVKSISSTYEEQLLNYTVEDEEVIVDGAIYGTIDDDILYGTEENDVIYSLAGADTVLTYEGDNTVDTADGNDIIYAGDGIDTIYAGLDNDTIYAGDGDDILYGNEGNDYIHGEAGNDRIEGGSGNDYLYGYEGDDFIDGGVGDDIIDSGDGNNTLYGGIGKDTIYLGTGTNFVDGGAGDDTIYGGIGIDEIYGGSGNDTIYSYDEADIIDGLSGDDIIYGGLGDDIINGNEDNDTLYGGEGNDTLYGESGKDLIYGGKGSDTIIGGEGNDTFFFSKLESNYINMDTIIDFNSSEDTIALVNQGTETYIAGLDISSTTLLFTALNLAASGDGSSNAIITWFQFEEYTYVVEDLSDLDVIDFENDIVVQLQGIIDINSSLIDLF